MEPQNMSKDKRLQAPQFIPLTIVILYPYFLVSCGSSPQAKKQLEDNKIELDKVKFEVVQLSQTSTERRIQVQTKEGARQYYRKVAAQLDGIECEGHNLREGETWGEFKGKCWFDVRNQSWGSATWDLVIRKDVAMRFAFQVQGCGRGNDLFFQMSSMSCASETVYKDLVIKGP